MPRLFIALLALLVIAPSSAPAQWRGGAAREIARERPTKAEVIEARERRFTDRRAQRRADRLAAWREQLEERRARARERFDVGRRGERVLRREVLAYDPSPESLRRANALAFRVVREARLEGLGVRLLVLEAPETMSSVEALRALEAADPEGLYELNQVFDPSAGSEGPDPGAAAAERRSLATSSGAGLKIGMIDTGPDLTHPALSRARVHVQAFPAGARATPAPHGTAVASLLVGEDASFVGALPGAELYVADVFGDADDGGSAEAIARAIGWMTQAGVSVVNVSLSGPPNRVLEAVCRRAAAQGVAIVAAVGNDGPTNPVAFPAAYPGVVAVTAIDSKRRVYAAANRGPEVAFAAAGVDVRAAIEGGGYASVSGTSFAAPHVVAKLARLPATERGIDRLAREAVDLGSPGRDPIYGFGAV